MIVQKLLQVRPRCMKKLATWASNTLMSWIESIETDEDVKVFDCQISMYHK